MATALMMTRGQAAPDVEATYRRARELCRQLGDPPELFPVLFGLWRFYIMRPDLSMARDLGERLLQLASSGRSAGSGETAAVRECPRRPGFKTRLLGAGRSWIGVWEKV